jgi:hypothetical protein
MKRIFAAAIIATLLTTGLSIAEPCDCWLSGSEYNALFATGTMETLTGTIATVTTFPIEGCGDGGVQLVINADDGQFAVHLGPEWYMHHQPVELKAGDKITVRGALASYDSEPTLLAQAIVKSNQMLVLRSPSGVPAWDALKQL